MLKFLNITNFALIEQINIEFEEGLNVLTGETGAGKSILIDALAVVTGSRVSQDSIRLGADYFQIEACFEVKDIKNNLLFEVLGKNCIELEEDTLIIVRRLNRKGKNQIIVNGSQITLNTLRMIGEYLIHMHGQHENQALLKAEFHLELLDNYDKDLKEIRSEYSNAYKKWNNVKSEIATSLEKEKNITERKDMLSWQIQEISEADLVAGEEEKISEEINILANAEKISISLNSSYTLLEHGLRGTDSVINNLATVMKNLESVASYDSKIESYLNIVTDSYYQLSDTTNELKDYCDELEFNPSKLANLEKRLDVIYKLKKKYGQSINEILEYYDNSLKELSSLENYNKDLETLINEKILLDDQLIDLSNNITELRKKAAVSLEKDIVKHLVELGMPKVSFKINVSMLDSFAPTGLNEVIFLFSANQGESIKPLNKIASGGELSRVALALKAISADNLKDEVMVFDEIDAGIGGYTAQVVAEKIARLATFSVQILCITHLPQIACMSDYHIHVLKAIKDERTITLINVLNESEQVHEIAKMLSGEAVEHSIMTASQMLESAKNKKKLWKNKV